MRSFSSGLALPKRSTCYNNTKIISEFYLTVEREIRTHQGQVQGQLNEVDEEIWGKGAQGWKLKRRTINSKGGWTDFS